jgi:hypothetical protein
MSKKTQICATVLESLVLLIEAEARKEDRSFSQMIGILLQLAIKEKTRKRNAAKDDT